MNPQNRNIIQKLTSLKKSKFRSKFRLTQKDRDYIAAKGIETIKEHAFQFVNARVAAEYPKNDGKQTPMRGHPVFIAQRMQLPHVVEVAFKSGMKSRKAEHLSRRRLILLWR